MWEEVNIFLLGNEPGEGVAFACSFAFLPSAWVPSFEACGVVLSNPHCCIGLAPKFTCRTCEPETHTWLLPLMVTFIPRTLEKYRNATISRVIVEARHAAMFTFHFNTILWPRSRRFLRVVAGDTLETFYDILHKVPISLFEYLFSCWSCAQMNALKIVFLTT